MKNILIGLVTISLFSCIQQPVYDVSILDVNRIDMETGQIENVHIYINQDRIALIQKTQSKELMETK